MKASLRVLIFMMLLNLFSLQLSAQCAMCKASVEKSETEAAAFEKRAKGLNAGILYLMVIPYIMAGIVAYYWYRNSKKEHERKKEVQRIIRSKLNHVQGGSGI